MWNRVLQYNRPMETRAHNINRYIHYPVDYKIEQLGYDSLIYEKRGSCYYKKKAGVDSDVYFHNCIYLINTPTGEGNMLIRIYKKNGAFDVVMDSLTIVKDRINKDYNWPLAEITEAYFPFNKIPASVDFELILPNKRTFRISDIQVREIKVPERLGEKYAHDRILDMYSYKLNGRLMKGYNKILIRNWD